uniref:Si:dkey-18j18.3 n=1 Tax=Cyprinus carpio TaxID=7962 RepID=A0A8C1QBG6_CYPCA
MDRKVNLRRATSAGYRLPDRPNGPLASQSSVSVFKHSEARTRNTGEKPAQDDDTRDPVKQDQVWREFVLSERTGVKEWEKNWSFLMNFDQLGHPRTETPLPSSVSLYSERVPNTTNQMFGSGLYTELGKELIRLDNLLTLTANHRKAKRNPEMQPC